MHEGVVDAADREAATLALRRDGLHVVKLDEDDAGLNLLPRRVTRSDIIYTTNQLAIMVETGISLAQAINGLQEQEDNPTLARLLGQLRSDVEAGDDFSAALARHPKYFDRTFVALVKSAERTGSLGDMLEQIATYLRKQLDHRSKVRSALAYPAVMMVLASGVTVFLLTYVLPKFMPIFSRKGIDLPKITQFVVQLSELLVGYWWAWLALVLAAGGLVILGPRTQGGRQCLDWLRIHAPIVGPLIRKVIISRSILTLGTMLRNGVAMLDALRLTAEVSGNYYYERAWLQVIDEISNGRRICDALHGNPLFPRTLLQMIGSGEETGKLDFVLTKVSSYYDREVETTLKTTTSLLEPLLIAVMGVVVGGIAMSLLLPIFTLSRSH
jgi:type IV pilus assembly protein PilC